jgi:DNA helicase-2/ATP-dependent DNA helicase PcrA
VIVFAAHDGLMPHRLTDDLEEERRVFHVALTRCRAQVVLLADEAAETPFVDDLTREPGPLAATAPAGRVVAPSDDPTDPPTRPSGPGASNAAAPTGCPPTWC